MSARSRSWVLGEFATPDELVQATARLRREGHHDLDTHSPYPVHGASEAMGLTRSRVPVIAFCGGAIGAAVAYSMQWYTNAVDYPINVGNRPPHSPAAFIPVTFELMVLFAALSIFFGMLALWRLPRPHHPLFESEAFLSASTHAFWVSVPVVDKATAHKAAASLRDSGASTVEVLEEVKE